jgi:hypothetical protein
MGPLGLLWECPGGASQGLEWGPEDFNGAHRRAPQRKTVKQYLTKNHRGHEVGPYLGALTGTFGILLSRAP